MTEPRYSEDVPTKPGRYVYRLWAADGSCLYVGCTGVWRPQRLSTRLGQHKRKPWWPQVTRIDVAQFADATDVVNEEALQIAQRGPVHNKCLLGTCGRGHDWTQPGARDENGACRECHREWAREKYERVRHTRFWNSPEAKAKRATYRSDPLVKAREASSMRQRRTRRSPGPGQEGLWA